LEKKLSKYQSGANFLTLHKPVEVNLTGESSEMSEDEALVKNIYINITSERDRKKPIPLKAIRKIEKSPNRIPTENKNTIVMRSIKSPINSKF
jgi:hypothetical protein